jgi:hypothetical protein
MFRGIEGLATCAEYRGLDARADARVVFSDASSADGPDLATDGRARRRCCGMNG